MANAGGQQWSRPDFSDAVPPTPPRQGDKGPNYYVDDRTFESGSVPANTGAIESNWPALIDDDGLDGPDTDFTAMAGGTGVANKGMGEGIRGFRSAPVGGTYNPGQGSSPGSPGTERSGAS